MVHLGSSFSIRPDLARLSSTVRVNKSRAALAEEPPPPSMAPAEAEAEPELHFGIGIQIDTRRPGCVLEGAGSSSAQLQFEVHRHLIIGQRIDSTSWSFDFGSSSIKNATGSKVLVTVSWTSSVATSAVSLSFAESLRFCDPMLEEAINSSRSLIAGYLRSAAAAVSAGAGCGTTEGRSCTSGICLHCRPSSSLILSLEPQESHL